MFNDIMKITLFFVLVCSLLSCGGGSSVSSVSLEAESTQLPPGGRTTLVAQADDSNPSGDRVSWSFRENNSGAVLDVIDNELDGNHQARAIYIAGNTPGIDVVQVSFKSGAKATVTITVGYDVNRIKLEQFGWDVLATAYNSLDLPVPGAQLDFFITAGTIGGSATTNDNGIARVSFSLPEDVNTARVTASSGTVSATLDVVRTFAASSVQSYSKGLSTSQMTSSIYVEQEGNTIKAKLLDSSGSPVVGVLLKFTIKDGILDHEMIFTDDDGLAEQMFLLNKDVSQSEIIVEGGGMSATLVVK
jgi:hypothetical protein